MSGIRLIASSDDFLLEQAIAETVDELRSKTPEAEVETLPDDVGPEALAVEMSSPSLFAAERILVLNEIRGWLKAAAPPDAPATGRATDPKAMVTALDETVPDGVEVVLGAWCARQPTGPLVDAIDRQGTVQWIAPPPAPKPWEDADLSSEQIQALRTVVRRAVPDLTLEAAAERLLFERLGFAPRRLVQEVGKLRSAAGDAPVTVDLVERLILPSDGTITQIQDALLARDAAALAARLSEAARGLPVRGWDGARIPDAILPTRIFGIAFDLFHRLLYTRCAVRRLVSPAALDPQRTQAPRWYPQVFKRQMEPTLSPAIAGDPGHPFGRKAPSPFLLGNMVRGASLYGEAELVAALAEATVVERRLRRSRPFDALSPWLLSVVGVRGGATER
jgi:hypothetical protein